MNAFEKHGIGHLSASSLNLFVSQPALWACSYLLKRRPPVGPAAHRGNAVEAGIEAGLFDPEMPLAECRKIAHSHYHRLTFLSSDHRVEKERECIDGSVQIGLEELRQYGVPEKPAEGRQHKIEVAIGDCPVPFIGFLDFVWPDHGLLLDLKTTSRIPSEISEAHARQGAIYAAAMGNHEVRIGYLSQKKIAVYVLQDVADHLASVARYAGCLERFLSLSDDGEKLTRSLAPDLSSFYWGDASARLIAQEIWGDAPSSTPSALVPA